MTGADDLCDDLDDLLADDVPDVATDPDYLWPPRPGLIWPGTFPVAQISRPACRCPVLH